MAVENRRFLRRAVRYLAADAGITQFPDIGTGLPTQGNVHQVAQDINPAARVVYVGNDPMVLTHSRALKTGGNTVVIEADVRDPRSILDHPGTRTLIDFSQPLAVLPVAVLHFISDDDDPSASVAAIRDALHSGSYLVLSHVTGDIRSESAANAAVRYKKGDVGGRHCVAGTRSSGSSPAWSCSIPGWSRSLTGGPAGPSLRMPARCGFSAVLAASQGRPRPGACDASRG